ncbi:MAG: D-alanine--D-alanine ligase family protein [Candidatus Limnocylindrales bacterium]|jgi:D-alanine-D-alanine ligase
MNGDKADPKTRVTERRMEGKAVVVLLGGPSAEHDVSVVSGWAIADSLAASGFAVERYFIDLSGRWWQVPATAASGRPRPGAFDDPAVLGAHGPWQPGAALDRLASRPVAPIVFPALHGPFGEDGTVQALLEAYDLPYTGAGVAASAVGMDKALYKRLVRGLGMPVVEWLEVTVARWASDRQTVLDEVAAFSERCHERRLMVKPARLGSSVGMSIAHTPAERGRALDEAFRFDGLAIVERYLDHPRELEVAVVGNEPDGLEAYGPGEIFPGREFYDYVAKYTDGVSHENPKAEVGEALGNRIRGLALDAYRAIGCEGFARVDFLLDGDTLYLNEINTIPGFTPISLFPQMAATGLGSFGAVCRRIVELAEERQAARVRRRLTTADLPR